MKFKMACHYGKQFEVFLKSKSMGWKDASEGKNTGFSSRPMIKS